MLPLMAAAQGSTDVLRYSLQYPSYDAVSLVLPGVAYPTGFGAYQENPASMALFDKSFMSFGISQRSVSETGFFLGNSPEHDDSQGGIGDIGFLYKVPTARGSLVVGGGYSQSTDFNRALSINGRNNQSTLTDFYNITPDDSLFFAAFDVYAIDFATTDSSFSETASIFRIGFAQYPGINQVMEMTERGILGEYTAFAATEFQENFYVGASIGLISGDYRYRREFLEIDRQNDYNFQFIDTDGDGQGDTDIDRIRSNDSIDATFTGFSARLGMVYGFTPNLRIGASYQFANTLNIDEEFNTTIRTTFDNGVQYTDDAPGRFSYKITRPPRANFGLAFDSPSGLRVSAAAEWVSYTEGKIEFDNLELTDLENSINSNVRSRLDDVVNLRGGLEYRLNESFIPRIGYGYYPSPQKNVDADRQFFSGGLSFKISENVMVDLGAQYAMWDDRNRLYYYDNGSALVNEVAREEVRRWHFMGGIKIGI